MFAVRVFFQGIAVRPNLSGKIECTYIVLNRKMHKIITRNILSNL